MAFRRTGSEEGPSKDFVADQYPARALSRRLRHSASSLSDSPFGAPPAAAQLEGRLGDPLVACRAQPGAFECVGPFRWQPCGHGLEIPEAGFVPVPRVGHGAQRRFAIALRDQRLDPLQRALLRSAGLPVAELLELVGEVGGKSLVHDQARPVVRVRTHAAVQV